MVTDGDITGEIKVITALHISFIITMDSSDGIVSVSVPMAMVGSDGIGLWRKVGSDGNVSVLMAMVGSGVCIYDNGW